MRFLVLILLLWAGPASALVRAGALSAGPAAVELALPQAVAAKLLVLDAPRRLVVDLAGVDAGRQVAAGSDASGAAVASARIGQFDASTARLVIELTRPMRVGSARHADGRLRLTLVPISVAAFGAEIARGRRPLAVDEAADPRPPATPDFDLPDDMFRTAAPPPAKPPPALQAPAPPRSGAAKPLVVIDAGHGGKDVGAIAVTGAYEKDVTLAIAKATARALERGGKVRVHLTRSDDRFLTLGARVAIARARRADLFVSVHADAAPNPAARGASVYTLSEVASDAVAARLAARENRADIIAGVNLGVEAPEVEGILIDLMRRSTMNGSIAFAERLRDTLSPQVPFRGTALHSAGFRVLKAADVPSVLFETGYVTNAEDAERLFSKAGQRTIGDGIARAIEAHLGR